MLVKIDSLPPRTSGLPEQSLQSETKDDFKPAAIAFETTQSIDAIAKPQLQRSLPQQSSWGVFATTFLTIFFAEFGDKTQLSTLLMSAESHAPWVVFCGAAGAMIVTSLLGVLFGRWVATRLTPETVEKLAGVSLLIVSMMLLWDVVQ